ncbi:MAG: heparan-alpha-glucosaminide N-acetyltransferase [Gammaproteobacteria bacterium]
MKKGQTPKIQVAQRYPSLDALRGLAIAFMIIYHFCFDLAYFGVLSADFNHSPFWLGLRSMIVTLFLGVMGMSLMLATRPPIKWRPYFRRLGILLAAAALVSLSSYFLFPESVIFFGVLHFIVLASVISLPFIRLYWSNLFIGIGLLVFGLVYQHEYFNHPWLQWFGLMTYKPITEDYVPLLPWFGVVLIGLFLGKAIYARAQLPTLARWQPVRLPGKILSAAGRHSLLIYLLHQPLLLGILYLTLAA